jgi:hypothetical protein
MHTPETTAPTPPPAAPARTRDAIGLRASRSFALVALSLALTFLFGLWLLSTPPMRSVAEALGQLSGRASPGEDSGNRVGAGATLLFLCFTFIGLLVLAWRLRVRSWWLIGGGWLAVVPVFVYLAVDEPSRRTIILEEMAPAFPGAEKSYAVLMRYGKLHPAPEALALEKHKFKLVGLPVGPDKPDAFVQFLHERRADIEADWAALAPQRRWLDELNAFDRIGDLGEASIGADIIRFSAWRLLSQRATAQAGLLALDGRGDDAFTTLLPVLEAARKLEPSGRSLVRLMVARVVQQMLIDAAAFTLQRTSVSPALRARMSAALKLGVGGEAGARRFVAIDYAGVAGWLSGSPLGAGFKWDGSGGVLFTLVDLFGPLVYNKQRTLNLYGDLIGELQELAARREGGKIDLRANEFWANEGRPRFKNFYGPAISRMTAPALSKVVDSYWKIEDKRLALIARLDAS